MHHQNTVDGEPLSAHTSETTNTIFRVLTCLLPLRTLLSTKLHKMTKNRSESEPS